MASGEITYASALANPLLRIKLRPFVSSIKWNSELASKTVKYFETRVEPGKLPEMADLRSFLSNGHLNDEVQQVLNAVKDFVLLSEDKHPGVIADFEQFYAEKSLTDIFEKNDLNASHIVDQVRSIPIIKSAGLPCVTLGNLSVDEVMKEEINDMDILPSSFKFIQKATPWGGYLRGQLVMVTAAPGCGKSLFILNEVLEMLKAGMKVYWVALGDMMKIDFMTRISSLYHQIPFAEVSLNVRKYYTEEVAELCKNLRLTVLPADSVDIMTISDFVESSVAAEDDIDCLVLDYDANLQDTVADNLYAQGRQVYNTMAKLCRPRGKKYRLGMIASQPKPQFWDQEELPKQCANESSGKQAVVDIMITIGKHPNIVDKHAGVMMAAKVRRGDEGVRAYYQRTSYGVLSEIERSSYQMMQKHIG